MMKALYALSDAIGLVALEYGCLSENKKLKFNATVELLRVTGIMDLPDLSELEGAINKIAQIYGEIE